MALSAIILAAGKATRMKSDRVKVLHEVCGRPMLSYVLDACRAAGVTKLFVVIGHDRERVKATYANATDITWVVQDPQMGTGHACLVCQDAMEKAGLLGNAANSTFVLCGDGPLIRAGTLEAVLKTHGEAGAAITLATCLLPDPTGYGRILRGNGNEVLGIIEHSDATPEQRAIQEVNPSYYLFQTQALFGLLGQVKPNNKKGEYYLTDTLELARKAGGKVAAVAAVPAEDVLSINSRADLAAVEGVMEGRIQKEVMGGGVTLVSPGNTWIEFGARIGQDTVLEPFTWIGAGARIGAGLRIKAGTVVPPGAQVDR